MKIKEGGKTRWLISLCLSSLSLQVLSGCATKESIEEACIRALRSGDEAQKIAAAKTLGQMGSVKAIPHLLVTQSAECKKYELEWEISEEDFIWHMSDITDDRLDVLMATMEGFDQILVDRQESAIPGLTEALRTSDPYACTYAAYILGGFRSFAAPSVPYLEVVKDSSDDERACLAAADALKKIRGPSRGGQ